MIKDFEDLFEVKIEKKEDIDFLDIDWIVKQRNYQQRSGHKSIRHPFSCNCLYCAIFFSNNLHLLPATRVYSWKPPFPYDTIHYLKERLDEATARNMPF